MSNREHSARSMQPDFSSLARSERSLQRHLVDSLEDAYPPGTPIPSDYGKTFSVHGKILPGGMGVCVPVFDDLNRRALVKAVSPHLHARYLPPIDATDRLRKEARRASLLASIDTEAFVHVYSERGELALTVRDHLGTADLRLPFYVMQWLIGRSLDRVIKLQRQGGTRIALGDVLRIARDVGVALRIAHDQGIIHRDLKPSNVYMHLPQYRQRAEIKLIDFGISVEKGEPKVGGTGTPRYLAPELLDENVHKEDFPSDVYAFGLFMYELATSAGPFDDIEVAPELRLHAYAEAHRTIVPRKLSEVRLDVPNAMADLVAEMLAKSPRARPRIGTIVDQLESLLAKHGSEQGYSNALTETAARPQESKSVDQPAFVSNVFRDSSPKEPSQPKVSEFQVDTTPDESVRIFKSTGEMFDASSVWDDNMYAESPFDPTEPTRAQPADPTQPSSPPLFHPERAHPKSSPPAPASTTRAARTRGVFMVAAAILAVAGVWLTIDRRPDASGSTRPIMARPATEVAVPAVPSLSAAAPPSGAPAPAAATTPVTDAGASASLTDAAARVIHKPAGPSRDDADDINRTIRF